MKKILALVLALALVICASFAIAEEEAEPVAPMSKEEFKLAEIDAPVCVEAYVQAAVWNPSKGYVSLYLQNEEGGFYAYGFVCTKEEADAYVPGMKVKVTGYRAEWAGEPEISDPVIEVLEADPFIAEAADVTALLGTDELADHVNEKITLKGLKVAASKVEGKEEEFAFLYNWDGSGSREDNNDLYFNVEYEGNVYQFTVESDLCGNESEAYQAVEALQIGDVIDCEGFLYWYNGPNPQITAVVKGE